MGKNNNSSIASAPTGWETAPIGELFQLNPSKPSRTSLPSDAPVTFVPMAAVDQISGTIANPETREFSKVRNGGYTFFAENDVLLAKITPCMENGKAAIARDLVNGMGFGTTEFHVFRSLGNVLPDFLYHFIRQERFRKDAEANMTGTVGQKRVPKEFVENYLLPYPSDLDDQRRIVAKLDQLLPCVESCRDRLSRIPALLKRFRQSVLSAACSGKLTEDWRAAHSVNDDLDKIIEGIKQRRLKSSSDSAKRKIEAIYSQEESEDYLELPEGWRYVALGKLCESFQYGTSAKSLKSGMVPVLRMGNLQDGEIDWNDLAFTDDKSEIAKYSLQPNSVLFNRTNSPELVGKTSIYRGEQPAIFAGYLIRVHNCPELNPEYLNFCLNSSYARTFCNRVKTDGVNQSNINAQKLASFELPFCPPAEQEEIVNRVNALLRLAKQIEQRYQNANLQVERLPQSILAKAFRGELA